MKNGRCRRCEENPASVRVEFVSFVGWYCVECIEEAKREADDMMRGLRGEE